MANFLKPDKIVKTDNGLSIKQKIVPDSLVATKDVASYVKKGQKMKPCKKLSDGTGKPKGITVHNTGMIKVATGTTAAEQYTRATYNGNMSGVMVHYYVWETDIWQLLNDNERGWHAADGTSRRKSQRTDGSKIGGNLDTIAIECIGDNKKSEDTTAKLVAYLCYKHGLNPATDVYTHKYFYPSKNCPIYILPHWSSFLATVKKYYNELKDEKAPVVETKPATKPTTSTPATKPTTPTVKTFGTAGAQIKLNKTNLYASSSAKTAAGAKTGIYYLWSNEVVNGRIRITNSKLNAGKANKVTGWVDIADITLSTSSTTKPTTPAAKPATKKYKKGDVVKFKGSKHYLFSTSKLGTKCKPGKAKITNIKEGKAHPYHLVRVSGGGSTVYGWVNAGDIE